MISDDDLLLYYYRDGLDAAERARIGTALAEQPELAQRLHRLVARLDTAAATPEVPVPRHIAAALAERAGSCGSGPRRRRHRRARASARFSLAAAGVGCGGCGHRVVPPGVPADRPDRGSEGSRPPQVAATTAGSLRL